MADLERLDRLDEFKLNSLQSITEYRDALGEFIIETDTWLVEHIQNSCLEPLRDLMNVTATTKNDEGQSQFTVRVRESLRKMWTDILGIIAVCFALFSFFSLYWIMSPE